MDEEQEYSGLTGDGGSEASAPNDDLPDGWSADEYDAYLQEVEAESDPVADPAPVAEAEEPDAPAINLPLLAVNGTEELFTADEAEQLNDMVLNGQFAQAMQIVSARQQNAMLRTTQRLMQAQTVYGAALTRAESEFPEVFATHGGSIRQIAASASPEVAGNPTTLFSSVVAPFILEVQAGADPIQTLKRMGRMLTKAGQKPASPLPASPAPSARVAPSPSRGGGSGVSPTRGRTPNVVKDFMELFNAEEGDVRRAIDAAKGR